MRPLRAHWTWELDAPRERLWHYLSDTDWVNDHAGLPRIAVRYEPRSEGGTRRYASFRQGPLFVEWEEIRRPWLAPEFFEAERRYVKGPLERFFTRTDLETLAPGRTRVGVHVELTAASRPFAAFLPLIAAQGKRGANRAFTLARRLAARDDDRPTPVRSGFGPFAPLRDMGISDEIIAILLAFVDTAEDRDLARIRPYELADRWKLARRDVLRAFLTATRAGIFNLRWNVICPACRGPSPAVASLPALGREQHCAACNIAFDAVFDRSVEVTFDARPLGRRREIPLFCVAGPFEDGHWPETIATAAHVTALQEFRDLFSSEVLAPGLELGIESIAVLFTDLVGSTAMYALAGDAPAFRVVTDHFEALKAVVSRYDGAIVKTIGDSVMAVFVDPHNCLQAALELDQNVAHIQSNGMPLRLRVGFHAGPCIAMRANDRIDYFGTTVNLASRLQSLADAGEVTMARTDAERPEIAARLELAGTRVSHEIVSIKGFPKPIEVVRLSNRP